jgi:3-dehydroquinate synthase
MVRKIELKYLRSIEKMTNRLEKTTKIKIALRDTAYTVYIGSGLLTQLGSILPEIVSPCKTMLVCDDMVDKLYSTQVMTALKANGFKTTKFVFKNGEASKNSRTYLALLEKLAKDKLTKTDLIIALGGGVVGDIAGFAASTYLRGINIVHIPTTLLAAVDSSIGGKTGINLNTGKNLIGTFYQPVSVVCDTDTLQTLEKTDFLEGLAEMIKYGVVSEKELFYKLFEEDPLNFIAQCVRIKGNIVEKDEFDSYERQVLNFGHTIGHAVEKTSGYSIRHGSAVAIGMAMISKAAERLGLCKEPVYQDLCKLLIRFDLPTVSPYNFQELFGYMQNDKKREHDKINLILPKAIGSCYRHMIDIDDLEMFIKAGLEK